MTLPTDIFFPKPQDYQDETSMKQFFDDFIFSLQNMYQLIAGQVNGEYRNYADVDSSQWVPTLQGGTAGAFTYTNQFGWVRRSGIITQIWADIEWSATTAAGNLYVELPYIVTKSSGMPFIGPVQASSITYATADYLIFNCIPNTYRGEIWNVETGAASTNLAVPASGRIIVSGTYIGTADG